MINSQQLELFPDLQAHVAETTPKKKRHIITAMNTDAFTVSINAALVAENLSFLTYSLMLAVKVEPGLPLAVASERVGQSYWAVRNQARRTEWFRLINRCPVCIELAPGALQKLDRVANRLLKP